MMIFISMVLTMRFCTYILPPGIYGITKFPSDAHGDNYYDRVSLISAIDDITLLCSVVFYDFNAPE